MPLPRPPRRPAAAQRGFSLLELVISMFIAVEILVAAAIAFDVHNRIAVVQTQVTDMQQSLRVAQYSILRTLRSAGRGGLPLDLNPDAVFNSAATIPELSGMAIEVRNNVTGDDRYIARGDEDSPQAIEGTDILTVRGCIGGTAYQVNPSDFNWDADDNGVADDDAELEIPQTSIAGILQPLGPLVQEIQAYPAGTPVTGRFVLVSPTSLQDYAVADIVGIEITGPAADPTMVKLTLDLNNNSPLNPVDTGDPNFATDPTSTRKYPENMTASMGCFLEEYRYYVREVAGDAITAQRPRLTRARFEPGTELPYLGAVENFNLDLADGIFDLQIALGLDTDFKSTGYSATEPGSYADDADWLGEDDVIYEASRYVDGADRTADDWLYNDAGDDPTDTLYTTHTYGTNAGQPVQVYFVRVTTVGRTSRPDPSYQAPDFDILVGEDWVEDRDYDASPANAYKTGDNLKHRRRVLQTVVDMRNI
jgi:type II secretory pathway pseudopilin PulG